MFLEACAVAITGFLAGGVINMLADALPTRQALRTPRYADGTRRPWFAWLGIGAFLFNLRVPQQPSGAELRAGSALLSWRHPLTEIASALLMLLFYADIRHEAVPLSSETLIKFVYAALLLLITVIDLEHRRIPFAAALSLGALALLDAALIPLSEPGLPAAAIGALIGFAVFYAAYLGGVMFARVLSRNRDKPLAGSAFGFGDVVLMAAVGLTVGFPNIILAVIISIFAAAAGAGAVIVARYIKTGSYQPFDTLPYGPFIAGSAIVVMLM